MPNLTFGPLAVRALQSLKVETGVTLDTHLMISEPERYLEKFAQAGSDIITVHVEACADVGAALHEIRSLGCRQDSHSIQIHRSINWSPGWPT